MLESISGRVWGTDGQNIFLEVGPVVLSLLAPGYFLRHVSAGDEARFHLLFQIVNEGNRGIPLAVAFPSTRDRDFFTKFISVSGIGVRAAVRAMTIPPGELASAIATGDIGVLKSLPGIGGSRAKQIVAKLQDSIAGFSTGMPASSEPGSASDARAILEQLGIPSAEAVSLVNAALEKAGPSASPSEIVRAAMKARS